MNMEKEQGGKKDEKENPIFYTDARSGDVGFFRSGHSSKRGCPKEIGENFFGERGGGVSNSGVGNG
jgi:hypothetical protein